MNERYWRAKGSLLGCRDCGVHVSHVDVHDAFHDRIDRVAAVLLQRDREEMEASEPAPHDDPCDCDDCRWPWQRSGSPDKPLLCAVCGEPVHRIGAVVSHAEIPNAGHWRSSKDHAATLTPPEPHANGHANPEPPVGSGWFADKWPGVLWFHDFFKWSAVIDGKWEWKPWPDLLPGRPAVPGGER